MTQPMDNTDNSIVQAVKEAYGAKAISGSSPAYSERVAKAFGYTAEELQSIPDESHMGLSCGNPVATAHIKEGETVLDLGCGGGIDIFLAAAKVGPNGQAIGLDMSEEMIARARRNAAKKGRRPPQVCFVLASLTESLPIQCASVDCILSNCVINLLPLSGKASVLKEAFRVLKPGGRIVLDDIVAKQPLPEDVKNDLALYIGCIAGAIEQPAYKQLLLDAGFQDLLFVDTKSDLNVYAELSEPKSQGCCSGGCIANKPASSHPAFDANQFVASYQIYAIKPGKEDKPSSDTNGSALLRWWDAYPIAKSSLANLSPDDVAALMKDTNANGKYAIIDVRRDDHAGGHVRGSYQYPAQSFYDHLAEFYDKFANTSQVIFYCGSSHGRGARCAGWYQDYLNEKGNTTSKAYVLEGGAKAWIAKFDRDATLIDHD